MFKKTALATFAIFSIAAQATELKTFSELNQAVTQGKELGFVIHLKACNKSTEVVVMNDMVVSLKPNAILLIPDQYVTASDKHFTLDDPEQPGMPVIDYSKLIIKNDNSAILKMTVMNAKNYHIISTQKLTCQLGEGMKAFTAN